MKGVRSLVSGARKIYYGFVNSKLYFVVLLVALIFLTIAVRDIIEKTLIQ